MDRTHEYETLYIISPDLSEEEQNVLRAKVVDTIKAKGGEIIKDELWGRRKLAYPIKKKLEGVYVLVRFKAATTLPSVVDTLVKRTPDILRHLTTVVTEHQIKEEARQAAAAEKRAEQARIAAEEAEKRAAEEAAAAAAAEEEAASAAEAEEASKEEAATTSTDEPSTEESQTTSEEEAPAQVSDTSTETTADSENSGETEKQEAVGE